MPTVRFRNMWSSFNPLDNPLLNILHAEIDGPVHVVRSPSARVDLEVCSVFPSRRSQLFAAGTVLWRRGLGLQSDHRLATPRLTKSSSATLGIWYTGENIRPPASGWDLTLSFDPTSEGVGPVAPNVYLPLWLVGSDMFGGQYTGFLGARTRIAELASPRLSTVADRTRFCCAFIRNPEPMRLRAIEALREVGPVDVYGMAGLKSVATKAEVARDYRFVLCFENDLYPGYVTEKLTDAWLTGAIPLWWGVDSHGDFDERAVVNFALHGSLKDYVEVVRQLDNDPARLNSVGSMPLLKRVPSDHELLTALSRLGLPTRRQ